MPNLHTIDNALVVLIGAEREQDVSSAIVDAIHELLPGSFIVAGALVPGTEEFQVVATAGLEKVLGPARRLLGVDPLATSYSMDDMRPEDVASYRSGRLERVEGGLHTLALGKLPGAACIALERLLGIGEIHAIGFAWDVVHYGGVFVGLPRGQRLEHVNTIEALVHQATIAIRRLRAEAELSAKTDELDSFFTESLDLLCIADTDGYFRRLNPEWERTLGHPLSELEGHRFLDLVHPGDQEATTAAVGRLAEGHAELRFVNRYRARDGSYRWLEWRAFPRSDLIYAAARDLTDRIEAEQALRESETRYRLIADNTADVIWLLDIASRRFTYVSPSVERLRGYTPEEVLKQSMEEVLTPESFRGLSELLPLSIAAVVHGDDETRLGSTEVDQPCKDGSIVTTEATTMLLLDDDGNPTQVLGVSRDITERKQAEAQIRALTESLEDRVRERTAQLEDAISGLEAFSYSVSHDLRAPLRAINGYATILAEDHAANLGAGGLRYCDNIIANTRQMGQLIDDLLSLARLGRARLAHEPIDMVALVRSAFGEIATDTQRGRVTLDVGDLMPATGDPTMLRQVWVNLLANALKFSAGVAEPRVEIGCEPAGSQTVYFVRDNGAGFDMQYADKLFGMFERLHGPEFEGTGVGLAIVRRAVEAHGGRVWAESEPGRGATLFFALPAIPPPASL